MINLGTSTTGEGSGITCVCLFGDSFLDITIEFMYFLTPFE